MLTTILTEVFDRDLGKLNAEIEQFDEADLWKITDGISNSAGNLCLHLTGNLNHFIGAVLGNSGYVRDRNTEFLSKGVPTQTLLGSIDSTSNVVKNTIAGLSDADLAANYPIEVFGEPMSTGHFLTHLATHLNYHLGQINYLRRFLTGK